MTKKSIDIIYISDEETLEYLASISPFAMSEMENDIEIGDVEMGIIKTSGLTTRELDCFFLYYCSSLTQQEVAEMLGILQPSVSRSIENGKKKLRKRLYF